MKILGIDTGDNFTNMVVLDQETGEIQQFETRVAFTERRALVDTGSAR